MIHRRMLILLTLVLWGAAPLPAQDPERELRFRVETEAVQVPVVVLDKKGRLYGELSRERFQLKEDGVPQTISSFESGRSPLRLVLLLEYSQMVTYLRGEVIRPAAIFVSQIMQPDDYVAMMMFDLRPQVLVDFTNQPYKLMDAVQSLAYSSPGFSESNLFDALKFALQGGTLENIEYKGLSSVEGRTAVLLVATGRDTFSRINFDQARRLVANAGVPVYSIAVGEYAFITAEPYLSGLQRLNYLQARNTLRTLSESSGGRSYSVRFQTALDSVLESIGLMLRHQYMLVYTPQNPRRRGKKRMIEVLVDIDGDGTPDQDQLDLQYRRFYFEPQQP